MVSSSILPPEFYLSLQELQVWGPFNPVLLVSLEHIFSIKVMHEHSTVVWSCVDFLLLWCLLYGFHFMCLILIIYEYLNESDFSLCWQGESIFSATWKAAAFEKTRVYLKISNLKIYLMTFPGLQTCTYHSMKYHLRNLFVVFSFCVFRRWFLWSVSLRNLCQFVRSYPGAGTQKHIIILTGSNHRQSLMERVVLCA